MKQKRVMRASSLVSDRHSYYKQMAKEKGLIVKKNQFTVGWTIILPNGSTYSAKDNADMIAYVKGY